MTTFAYTLTFDDGEGIALKAAIDTYLALCEQELAEGPKAPYWAHARSLKAIEARMYEQAVQTSGSSAGEIWIRDVPQGRSEPGPTSER